MVIISSTPKMFLSGEWWIEGRCGIRNYDESQKINYMSYSYPMKLGLPAGKYAINVSGQFQQVEIKDGEVTEF